MWGKGTIKDIGNKSTNTRGGVSKALFSTIPTKPVPHLIRESVSIANGAVWIPASAGMGKGRYRLTPVLLEFENAFAVPQASPPVSARRALGEEISILPHLAGGS